MCTFLFEIVDWKFLLNNNGDYPAPEKNGTPTPGMSLYEIRAIGSLRMFPPLADSVK